MKGGVRKKGATWSYRVEFGTVNGKRTQIERSGFRTKGDATKAMNEVIYNYNTTGDFIENKKITFCEVFNEFIEKEATLKVYHPYSLSSTRSACLYGSYNTSYNPRNNTTGVEYFYVFTKDTQLPYQFMPDPSTTVLTAEE